MSRITHEHGVEIWADIPGYEGWYEVSNLGRVRRIRSGGQSFAGRILAPLVDDAGYRYVTLSRDGQAKPHFIHRLVLRAFRGEPVSAAAHGRHDNGDKSNNLLWHLLWGSPTENGADTRRYNVQRRMSVRPLAAAVLGALICSRCGRTKPESGFAVRKPNGCTHSWCNACRRDYLREWRAHRAGAV
jgi:hypothetical protein